MKNIEKKGYKRMKNKIVVIALFMTSSLTMAAPLGFLQPFNFMVEPEPVRPTYHAKDSTKLQWGVMTQLSFDTISFNENGDQVNALQIYEPTQNIFGLYQGTGTSDKASQFINSLAGGSGGGVTNGQNGLFTPTGTFSGNQVAFFATYMFHANCYFKIALPVYKIALSDVTWTYLGNSDTFAGQSIQTELINNFMSTTYDTFGLWLNNWQESGLGDLEMYLDYINDYPQGRPVLRNVRVHLRAGLTFPTQEKQHNYLMEMPFGNDGSMTLPFGGGLDINLGRYFQCGFRGQFSYFWGNQAMHRVKTFESQTTLFLPQYMSVYKNYSLTQMFDLYVQAYNVTKGLSLKLAYEYYKSGPNTVSVNQPGFNELVMNSDWALAESTSHTMILMLSFDSLFLEKHDKIRPQASIFFNIPFNGSLITLANTVGLQLSLDF